MGAGQGKQYARAVNQLDQLLTVADDKLAWRTQIFQARGLPGTAASHTPYRSISLAQLDW